jgi:hypothetical protein
VPVDLTDACWPILVSAVSRRSASRDSSNPPSEVIRPSVSATLLGGLYSYTLPGVE